MAVVLAAFASKLASILMGIAKEEVEMLLGVPGEITKLETTIGDLTAIMADAEVACIRSNAVERWVRELKDAMYDVDDILDLCQIMEGPGGREEDPMAAPSRSASRCFSITPPTKFFCFRKTVAVHEIGRKIKALNKRLRDITERSSRFGFIVRELNSSLLHSSTKGTASSDNNHKTGSSIVRSGVVGNKIERVAQELITLLLQDVDAHGSGSGNMVVSAAITGTGGIGKTTLARMVFNDTKVEQNFDKRIWLSINKEVDQISVLRSVIAALGAGGYDGGGGTLGGSRALLECALKQAAWRKKLLVVMDDVWSEDVWSDLLSPSLVDSVAPGSRVLVTTRNDEVAHKMEARHLHRVGKLEDDDAWVLLKKQVVSDEIDDLEVDGVLKDIGMKIVEKCEGLPLAIKVLGGHLFHIRKTRDAWARVRDHFAWSIPRVDDDINKAIYLSYEELPSDLKQCFLYCSLFPNNEPIRREDLVNLWISEGYVNNKTTAPMLFEDLGLEHYRELVSRNLLEPKKGSYNQSSFTMHDVTRSFAQYITKYEGVLVGDGQDANIALAAAPKIRRLSISNKVVEPGILRKQVSLRTLMLFGSTVVNSKELWSNLSSCLRVLHLDNVNLDDLPDSICHLKHLRWLSLCTTSISTIPEVIGDLQFLQGIELVKCSNISQLPNSILKLRKLRLLNISGTNITSVPRGFGKLRDMVIMGGFPTCSDDGAEGWCSLEELGPLTKLRVLGVIGLEKAPSGSVAARAKLCNKEQLKELYMEFTSQLGDNGELGQGNISREEQDRAEQVLDNLCPPTCIEELGIKGYYGSGLPQWARMMQALFRGLRRLVLDGYACQLPNGLGQLPFLAYLWVNQAPAIQCIGHGFLLSPSSDGQYDAAAGTATDLIMSRQFPASLISRGTGFAFPKLTVLGFEGMSGWAEWEWEQHIPAMPALEGIVIDGCRLHHLPPGLARHATQLTLLDLRNVLNLVTIESFPSLTELKLWDNPRLESVRSCPRLYKITICSCPSLKLLENLPVLGTAMWMDVGAETLPTYLQEADQLSKLNVYCRPSLFKLISLQYDTPEWGKVQHVQRMEVFAMEAPEDGLKEDGLKGYIVYTKEPYSFYAHLF